VLIPLKHNGKINNGHVVIALGYSIKQLQAIFNNNKPTDHYSLLFLFKIGIMNKKYRPYLYIAGILALVFFIWYFFNIVVYVVVAAVLSIIGRPLVKRLQIAKIGRWNISSSMSALITLVLMIMVFTGFVWFFVPMITNQARVISAINTDSVLNHYAGPIKSVEGFLTSNNIIQPGETIESSIKTQIESVISVAAFSNIFANIIGATGNFLMGTFTILFITFFFLRDTNMLTNFLILLVPREYEQQMQHILSKMRSLLSGYFLGLLGELLTMMTLLTIGLTIIGVENALLIGFLGGLLNIIPYLGPLIGASIAVLFGVTGALSTGMYDQIIWIAIGTVIVWLIANAIDNVLYQPFVYSNVVKARPLEIFLVIIMAGSLAGVPGMILAIPAYTVIRIIAKEFFSDMKLVKKLTENL